MLQNYKNFIDNASESLFVALLLVENTIYVNNLCRSPIFALSLEIPLVKISILMNKGSYIISGTLVLLFIAGLVLFALNLYDAPMGNFFSRNNVAADTVRCSRI